MKRILFLMILILGITACSPARQFPPAISDSLDVPPPSPSEPASSPTDIPSVAGESATGQLNIFSMLPAPICNGTLTPSQGEGPYYTPNTPERNSLLEEGIQGEILILIGYVLDANCQPVPNAWLDFWQADTNGDYDNVGYTLRGHQYTDAEGRYYLETVLPGLYQSRPIEHIHVKIQAPNGNLITSQLYFPNQPVEHLTVQLTQQDGYWLGIFNFVIR